MTAPHIEPGPRPQPVVEDYLQLLDASERALLVLDAGNTVLFANARARAWFRGTPLVGRPAPAGVAACAVGGHTLALGDGTTLEVRCSVEPLTWAGSPAVVVSLEDFARQRDEERRQGEIAQQLRRFRSLVDTAGDGFFIVAPTEEFRLVYVNDAGVRHSGWSREELLGMRLWEWDPNFTPETTHAFWRMLRTRGSAIYETTARHRDGGGTRVEVAANHVVTEDGEFLAGSVRDISARARAEAELRDSEERFRAVFEEASDALLLVDPANHRFIDCNAKAIALFEAATKAEMLAVRGPELVDGSLTEEQVLANRAAIARDGIWNGQLEYRTLRGRRFWGAVVVRRISVGGKALHIIRVTDTTETRRLTELLADTERLARIGGWELHLEAEQIVWTNGSYLIHGIEPGTAITPEQALSLFEPGFRERFDAAALEGLRTGQPWTLETRIAPRGEERWVRILGNSEALNGVLHRLHGTIEDITESRLAEARLRERDERLQEQALLLDEATDAIVVCDATGLIEVWNRGAEQLLGWSREEAVGRHAGALHFADQASFSTVLGAAREAGMWNGELEYRTRGETRVLVESRWTLRHDAGGRLCHILTINTDITEKKRREALRLRAQRLESIGTLAGGIAHDLNNILAPVVLSSDILRMRLTDPADLELVGAIGTSARRGAEVVRQVLSFARGVEGTHIPINIRHLLPEIRHIVSETFPRGIACRVEAPLDLWSVMGEPTQIHQLLLNLCLNSRDAMPEGGTITLRAANASVSPEQAASMPGATPGAHVRIQVIDTGSGIAPEIRERMFEPFFTTRGPGGGSGLGLSTAMAIVRSHRGFIAVDTEPGRGTTIAVHFPAEQPSSAGAPAPTGGGAAEAPGRGQLVLVIDDEASVRSITRQSLETAGYRVLTAEDGARGISLFMQRRDEIALVLTDMMMPVMDGVAVIKALRRAAPAARIIAVSGAADVSGLGQTFLPAPPVGFLLKPFNLDSLLRAVHEALGSSPTP